MFSDNTANKKGYILKNDIEEFAKMLTCYEFNSNSNKFVKTRETQFSQDLIKNLIYILNFLDEHSLEYDVDNNQNIVIKSNVN